MSRTRRASAAASLACGVLVVSVFTNGVAPASAEPVSPEGIAGLVAAVANADQKLQELGAAIQAQQEGVNKSLVEVQTARDAAAAAHTEIEARQEALGDANAAIASAQQRFDTFAASTYVNGPSASYVTASDPAAILQTAAMAVIRKRKDHQNVTPMIHKW